ncbi:MAG: hypothetical protein Q8L68_07575, partial [Methylococcales bacterium]|nr:hypothetical protein [Methylococcales bacterium]
MPLHPLTVPTTLSFEARLESLHNTLTAFESQVRAYKTNDAAPHDIYHTIHAYLKSINDHFVIDDQQNYSSEERACLTIFKFIGESLYWVDDETGSFHGGNKDILVLSIASMNRLVKLFMHDSPNDFADAFTKSKKDQLSLLKRHLLLVLGDILCVSILLTLTIFAASILPLVVLPVCVALSTVVIASFVFCAMLMSVPIFFCIRDLRIINHINKLSKLSFFNADAETRSLLAKDRETSIIEPENPSSN